MQPLTFTAAALSALLCTPLFAQVGNEVIFVGSSTSGDVDQHALVESLTGSVLAATGDAFTNNVNNARWAHQGRRLYLSRGVDDQVTEGVWNGSSMSWSTLYSAPGDCYGVEYDVFRERLWTLTGTGTTTRELHCIDVDLDSPTYGDLLFQTSALTGVFRERWALSYAGTLAAVPPGFLSGGAVLLLDLDPQSQNFGNIQSAFTMPDAASAGFSWAVDCRISVDEMYVYVLWGAVAAGGSRQGLAVYDRFNNTLLDFDLAQPGQQDFALQFEVPNRMALSFDRAFAVVSGQDSGGWVGRIDFDYANPGNTTFTRFLGAALPGCNGVSLSPDETRVAVTSETATGAISSRLTVLDVVTGAALQSVPLPALENGFTTAWQDASPVAAYEAFGAGCVGTAGMPSLAAQAGSRPALGGTLTLDVGNLPFGVAAVATGLSDTATSSGLPLPLDLSVIGMTGCTQYVDSLFVDVAQATGPVAGWSLAVPGAPSLFGVRIYNQAYSLDPAANPFGFVASNAGVGTLGF